MPPHTLDTSISVPQLAARAPEAHKGTYGRVLVAAGSRGMSGAAVLCGSAALRGGAGLVQVAVPAEVLHTVAAGNPCYLATGFEQDTRGQFSTAATGELVQLATDWSDVVAVGPGVGQSESMPGLIATLIGRVRKPLVIDADGLNALSRLPPNEWPTRNGPLVLTPHPGEFARLTGLPVGDIQHQRQELAASFALEHELILVLKGHGTIVTDGKRLYRNTTGNPGMATGGTGDVLTGLIAALIGQGLSAFDAALLGVWVHGRAGDLAAERVGQTALIATDLLTYLPAALREVGG